MSDRTRRYDQPEQGCPVNPRGAWARRLIAVFASVMVAAMSVGCICSPYSFSDPDPNRDWLLEGHVYEAGDSVTPIARVKVSALRWYSISDATGWYRMKGEAPPGEVQISAMKEGYERATATFRLESYQGTYTHLVIQNFYLTRAQHAQRRPSGIDLLRASTSCGSLGGKLCDALFEPFYLSHRKAYGVRVGVRF